MKPMNPAPKRHCLIVAALAGSLLAYGCGNDGQPSGTSDLGQPGADTSHVWEVPGANEPFGRLCTKQGMTCSDKDTNGESLWCNGITGGTAGYGFCTRECTQWGGQCYGVPNGQWSSCVLSGAATDAGPAKEYCAFFCLHEGTRFQCPGTLRCEESTDGKRAFCVP
jgi:hypothetical protein